jgi:hypothetical protein
LTVGAGPAGSEPRKKSGISAACAPDAAPNITAANRNPRIAMPLQILKTDYHLLTLTNPFKWDEGGSFDWLSQPTP